jgi:hypothetical protein
MRHRCRAPPAQHHGYCDHDHDLVLVQLRPSQPRHHAGDPWACRQTTLACRVAACACRPHHRRQRTDHSEYSSPSLCVRACVCVCVCMCMSVSTWTDGETEKTTTAQDTVFNCLSWSLSLLDCVRACVPGSVRATSVRRALLSCGLARTLRVDEYDSGPRIRKCDTLHAALQVLPAVAAPTPALPLPLPPGTADADVAAAAAVCMATLAPVWLPKKMGFGMRRAGVDSVSSCE